VNDLAPTAGAAGVSLRCGLLFAGADAFVGVDFFAGAWVFSGVGVFMDADVFAEVDVFTGAGVFEAERLLIAAPSRPATRRVR
jgi:hypothetical protein